MKCFPVKVYDKLDIKTTRMIHISFVLFILFFIKTGFLYSSSTDFELFYPSTAPQGTFMTESAKLFQYDWTTGTYLQIERSPVVLVSAEDPSEIVDKLVYYRFQFRGIFTYNFLKKLALSLDFPVTLLADQFKEFGQTYLNDFVLKAKYQFPFLLWKDYLHLGVMAFTSVNTGYARKFGGTDARFMQPGFALLSDLAMKKIVIRFNLGYEERDYTFIKEYGVAFDDKIFYGFSFSYKHSSTLTPFVEYRGSTQVLHRSKGANYNDNELYFGMSKLIDRIVLNFGGSIGLSGGIGVPSWRMILGVFYVPEKKVKQKIVPVVKKKKRIVKKKPERGEVVIGIVNEEGEPLSDVAIVIMKDKKKASIKTKFGIAKLSLREGNYKLIARKKGYYQVQTDLKVRGNKKREIKIIMRKNPLELSEKKNRQLGSVSFRIINFKTGKFVKKGEIFLPEMNVKDIFRDGKWSIILKPGTYRFVFTSEGYYPINTTVTVGWNQNVKSVIEMVKREKKEKVVVTEKEIFIKDKILFKTNSARILPKSYPILDALVETIKKHPEIEKIIIKGHTDSVGSRKYNLRLSQRRANAVRNYLIKKGIPPQKLEAVGYGEDYPIADNSTSEGRAMNRRVEFEIVRRKGSK